MYDRYSCLLTRNLKIDFRQQKSFSFAMIYKDNDKEISIQSGDNSEFNTDQNDINGFEFETALLVWGQKE